MIIAKHGDKSDMMFDIEETKLLLKLVTLGTTATEDKELHEFAGLLNRGATDLLEWMEGKKKCQP